MYSLALFRIIETDDDRITLTYLRNPGHFVSINHNMVLLHLHHPLRNKHWEIGVLKISTCLARRREGERERGEM